MKKYVILLILALAALGVYVVVTQQENKVPVTEATPDDENEIVPRHFDVLLEAHNGHVKAVTKLVVEYANVSAEKAEDIVGVLPYRLEVKMNKKQAAHFKDVLDKAGATSEIIEIKAKPAGDIANGPFKDSDYVEVPVKK